MISAISSISLFIFIILFALFEPNFYFLLGIFPLILLLIITGTLLIKFLYPEIPKPKSLVFEKKHLESRVHVFEYSKPIVSEIIDIREQTQSEILKKIPNFNTKSKEKTLAIQFSKQSDIKEIPSISNQKNSLIKSTEFKPIVSFKKEINTNNSAIHNYDYNISKSNQNSEKENKDEHNNCYLPHYPIIKLL